MARLTPDNTQRAREVIALYPQPRSALIPVLHIAQEQDGYLTGDAMAHIGELIGLNAAEVRGTATFYDMLFLEPVGKYLLSVCTNIACLLNGAYELLEHIESKLGVKAGGTTADGVFTVEEVECIALCGNAPCLTANWRFFGDVTDAKFDALVDDLRMGRLSDVVPPHGTLCRTSRAVGLPAAGYTGPAPAKPAAAETPAPPAPAPSPPAPAASPPAAAEAPAPAPGTPVESAASDTTAPAPVEPAPPVSQPHGSQAPATAPDTAQPPGQPPASATPAAAAPAASNETPAMPTPNEPDAREPERP
ncbi:MAG TPA: NAD(P)H-dependent oxidoreductase subunit E [Acidimicrobiales bacterium]|nr:NAD(P)H-dependent oxidoreductase subunit E [Acidimicrobiales bacterium]